MNEERLETFMGELQELSDNLVRPYEGHEPTVLDMVSRARNLLSADDSLGPWENDLLESSEDALRHNFLSLAVHCIARAIVVHQLPREEYEYGYNFNKGG